MTNPKIISAEGTRNHIGFGSYRGSIKDEEKQLEVDILDIGPGYASTMGLRLIEGRLFDESGAAAGPLCLSLSYLRKSSSLDSNA